jgi:hypothetical protein
VDAGRGRWQGGLPVMSPAMPAMPAMPVMPPVTPPNGASPLVP